MNLHAVPAVEPTAEEEPEPVTADMIAGRLMLMYGEIATALAAKLKAKTRASDAAALTAASHIMLIEQVRLSTENQAVLAGLQLAAVEQQTNTAAADSGLVVPG